MNNMKWLRTLDADELSQISECDFCAYRDEVCTGKNCVKGKLEWLIAEHVEPDSWEKLLAELDAAKASTYSATCKYFGAKATVDCSTCRGEEYINASGGCNAHVLADIASRIRALRGDE